MFLRLTEKPLTILGNCGNLCLAKPNSTSFDAEVIFLCVPVRRGGSILLFFSFCKKTELVLANLDGAALGCRDFFCALLNAALKGVAAVQRYGKATKNLGLSA